MIELDITFDGETPGLQENRLSMRSFGKPLQELLRAIRMVASAHMAGEPDNPDYGKKGGKRRALAMQIDLQLRETTSGSFGLGLEAVFCPKLTTQEPPDTALTLQMEEVLEWAVRDTLQAVEGVSDGGDGNWAVRKYLKALPTGLTKHSYCARREGRVISQVEVDPSKTRFSQTVPVGRQYRLVEVLGRVTGIEFSPTARIKLSNLPGHAWVPAEPTEVERAIEFRAVKVRSLVLEHVDGAARLLWIRPALEPLLDERASVEDIEADWGDLLELLSK